MFHYIHTILVTTNQAKNNGIQEIKSRLPNEAYLLFVTISDTY